MWKEEAPLLTRQISVCGSMRHCTKSVQVQSMGAVCAHFLFLKKLEVSIINKKVIPNNVNDDLVNEKIRFREVLVIGPTGQHL